MADIEILINELPQIVYKLKLTIGNSQDIMQQVVLINNAQEQLRNIKQAIAQELCCVTRKANNNTVSTISYTIKSLIIPNILQVNPAITGNPGLITEKFGNPETDISLISLQSKINCWLEWGDLLQAIAADILGDANLVNQINLNINYPSLSIQIIEIENRLNINNSNKHKLSHRQILNIEEDLSRLQNRLNLVKNTIQNTQSLLTIMIALSSFCGKSGFSIEWLDDAHELIISSNEHFRELTEIINECDIFEEKINGFQAKLEGIKHKNNQSVITNNHIKRQKYNLSSSKVLQKTLFIFSGLTVLGVGGWFAKEQIMQIHQIGLNLYQENIAKSNFKAALKLGMEASSLAQNPPHALNVWQQAASKWQEAINLLKSIPEGTSVSVIAQEKLVRYQLNYIAITKRATTEKKAVANLELAEKLATEAKFFMETSPNSLTAWQQAKDKWHKSIKLLESIPKSSSVYGQAQSILPNYKSHYAAINAIMQNRIQSVN
ncbi:hypothetical protein [Nostoc sp. UHCC 0870]|uniref:hypothetical protein n=1 Tax=Nostoc sp. UHCC 0870 TaxID=2914041 RepID=UPI001EDEFC69|nr:hypothetical protein [Nostoc sp. UHCC 0870]UKO96214.1 hypothetical protein L6494_16360 [Nostoc sp. UHCC 0870]